MSQLNSVEERVKRPGSRVVLGVAAAALPKLHKRWKELVVRVRAPPPYGGLWHKVISGMSHKMIGNVAQVSLQIAQGPEKRMLKNAVIRSQNHEMPRR